MGWTPAVILLLAFPLLGGAIGLAWPRFRTALLALVASVAAFGVYAPGVCVTAIAAATTSGDLPTPIGGTACDTYYGARLPELAGIGGHATGYLLVLGAVASAVAAFLVARRARSSRERLRGASRR